MTKTSERFLEAVKASLNEQTVYWDHMSEEEWKDLFGFATIHQLLPLIYQSVYPCLVSQGHQKLIHIAERKSLTQISRQVNKTKDFLLLYKDICDKDVKPLVLKGLVCRNLYPQPDQRPSTDEDIFIRSEDFDISHQCCLDFGMHLLRDNQDILSDDEVSYWKDDTKLYIELHKTLFSSEEGTKGDWNELFEGVHERTIRENIQGIDIYTLNYTDHLLYLICHALKHFIGGGFGIRQVCDITMFANKYGNHIDWEFLLDSCKRIDGEKVAAAIFRIGETYFTFDAKQACYPKAWREIEVELEPLLEDMLTGGILGASSPERLHSNSITIQAVASQNNKNTGRNHIFSIFFPPKKYMVRNYKYLDKHPYLLPVAWISRMFRYGKDLDKKGNNPVQSIQIGEQRKELLKKYGVLK